jgi:hypothetical protein
MGTKGSGMTTSRATIATCNLCGFKVPYDEIGVELMKAHLKDKHNVRR